SSDCGRSRRKIRRSRYRFTLGDVWARKLFLALLRRYGLEPFRYAGQRYTTVMVRVPVRFVKETLWPEFTELCATLRGYLDGVTERVVAEVVDRNSSEAAEVAAPRQLASPALDK